MTRPTDWSALGLDSDPTPGDPDQVQDVYNLINTLAGDYQTILDTISKINGTAESGNLEGAAAQALKDQMNGRITKFVQSAHDAYTQAAPALKTYMDALTTHQTTADNLLTQAQNSGLKSDDSQVKGWASSAKQAGTDLQTAENTAATAVQHLPGPSDPLSPWQEFLQILGWIAIILILPAMVFGGVFALAALVVNAILFVNALVEFAKGELSFGGLLLAALGVIAPTTRALDFGSLLTLIKGAGSYVKSGFVTVKAGLNTFIDVLHTTKFTDLMTVENLVKLGNFALKGGVWVFNGLKDLPTMMGAAAETFATKLGELFVAGGLKVYTSLKTGSFLSLILPIDATEVEVLGLGTAFRLGFIERGFGITASPETNLAILAKTGLAGMGESTYHFTGFGYLDSPRPTLVDIDITTGNMTTNLAKVDANFNMAALDLHLESPTLNINNLAAGFTHGSLDVGTVSVHIPSSNFGLSKLEIPDLRYPKELQNIGNGTVITKMNDLSFVTVREDKAPMAVDTNLSDLTVPGLHTGNLTTPAVHTGDLSIPAVHTGDVNVSGLHAGDLGTPALSHVNVPNLGTNSLHVATANLPQMHDMPNLSAITNTRINVAETHGISVTQTDASVKVGNMPTMTDTTLTDTSFSGALSHVATPTVDTTSITHISPMTMTGDTTHVNSAHVNSMDVNVNVNTTHVNVDGTNTNISALQHLATNSPTADVRADLTLTPPQLNLPHLNTPHLSSEAHIDVVPTEIRTLQANPEIGVHADTAGMQANLSEAQVATPAVHTEVEIGTPTDAAINTGQEVEIPIAGPSGTNHVTETEIPAVSSSSIDDALVHSAGAPGEHFSEPDLAGKVGLIDPDAEKLAVAWSGFRSAQRDYMEVKAEYDVQFNGEAPKGSEPTVAFKGKAKQTPAQLKVYGEIHTAGKALNAAAAKLEDLDTSAADLTLDTHSALTDSLNQRPRLVGGSRPGDRPLGVNPQTGLPSVLTRSVGPDHELLITTDGTNEYGQVVNVHTRLTEDSGVLTESTAHGGFRITGPGPNHVFTEYLANGDMHAWGLNTTDEHGAQFGDLTVYDDNTADLRIGTRNVTGLNYHAENDGNGFYLFDNNHQNLWKFDGQGQLWFKPVQLTDHLGGPTKLILVDTSAKSAHLIDDDGTLDDFTYIDKADGSGNFRLIDPKANNNDLWHEYTGNGQMVGMSMPLVHYDGHGITTVKYDLHGAPQTHSATLITPGTTRIPQGRITINGNEIDITLHDGSVITADNQADRSVLVRADLNTRLPDNSALRNVRVDFTNNTARFHAPDLPDQTWNFSHAANHQGFTLTSPDGVHVLHFDQNNTLTGHDINARDPRATGALSPVRVQHATNQATFTHPDFPGETQWTFAPDGDGHGGFSLINGNGVHMLKIDAAGQLHASSFSPLDPVNGQLTDLFVLTDHTAGANPPLHVLDVTGAVYPGFTATRNAAGHYVVTFSGGGLRNGSHAEYNGLTGTIRNEHINLQDHGGLHVEVNHLPAGGPTTVLRDNAGTNFPRLTITRVTDAANRPSFVVTDTAATHVGNTRTFDATGKITAAHIGIRDAKGNLTGEHFDVTFDATGTWTRTDGRPVNTTLPNNLGYGGSGSAKIFQDGRLVLTGPDKTSVYEHEKLSIGQDLELFRFPDGKRRWMTFNSDGDLTGTGFRRFGNDDGGVDAKDVNVVGMTIRQYRIGNDGGIVRGEKFPDGTFRWTRFTKEGTPTLSGIRSRPMLGAFGWKDTYTVGGNDVVAQEHWSAFNPVAKAGHYREYGIGTDAAGAYVLKDTYKEVSQQGKDTGSLDVLTNGNKLEFTRYSEQRIPDFLWKTPENLDPGLSKVLAKSYLGSKWGGVDFPRSGFFLQDSRYQVFKWTERDATDTVHSEGVRVVTPDGSSSDFAADGLFVRGVIKLENGGKIEIGRAADGKWDTFQLDATGGRPANTLRWTESGGDTTISGLRTFNGKNWVDTFQVTGDTNTYVARATTVDGDVMHFTGTDKPHFDTTRPPGGQFSLTNQLGHKYPSVTRNTMGQIVTRTDHFPNSGTTRIVTGEGDPRTGEWHWTDQGGQDGIRISSRNTPLKGSWDDGFADFRLEDGRNIQIRDFRALDGGKSIRSVRLPAAMNPWTSAKYDAKGDVIPGTTATREWKHSNGIYYRWTQPTRDPKMSDWRDIDTNGNILRASIDGKVREYTDPANGLHAWKEYDFGSVWRERQPIPGHAGYFLEKENFQKQWRVTNTAGVLFRYRSIRGNIMERNTFGQWTMVGTERETKGLIPALTDFRGLDRQIREPNRFEFTIKDGAVGTFQKTWIQVAQKSGTEFLLDFAIDVGANIIITGATDGWNFSGAQWGTFLVGAAIRSGVKAGYGVLTETTALKNFRDGLRNVDGGKDWNRQPYNNDKHWDNEWAGNENPTRWRSGAFDYFVGNTFVPAFGSLIANLVTGSTFGYGEHGIKLDGGNLWAAAGLSMAGSAVGGLTFGAIKTLGHLSLSGRWFHQAGFADIALTFGEKMAIDFIVNDWLSGVTGLSGSHEAKNVEAGQESSGGGDGKGSGDGTQPQGG